MVAGSKLTKQDSLSNSDPSFYRSIFGALQYATNTRPDISFLVNKMCQFMALPKEAHWQAAKRFLRYLKGTISLGLHLKLAFPPVLLSKPILMQTEILTVRIEDPPLVRVCF